MNNHVLGDFAKADAEWVEDLLRGVAEGAPALAAGDSTGFLNAVAQRMPAAEARRGRCPIRHRPPARSQRTPAVRCRG